MSQNFNFFSQPVGLGLLVEHLTCGVEHPADIIAYARDSSSAVIEILPLLH